MAYALGEVIGRGGMGEVLQAHDDRIGRDVALKRLTAQAPSGAEVERFLREARIQARLDHPAIVPVHDVGLDAQGRPYFTMKRLTGVTLREQLPSEPAASQRLLRAFVDVCLAIELAHSRDVVHRDLKPSNIMLGDFGEVYVIDWGLARVLSDTSAETELHGTPGYIAPEQLITTGEVGRPADVYALGSILFELLTKQPVHPRKPQAAIESTLSALTIVSPQQRAPELAIPPELDVLCTEALALDALARPTAKQLALRVQAYLDGDRDLARRRQIASEQLTAARHAHATGDRPAAMSSAGRALALDPECHEAAGIISALMLEPPRHAPPALRDALREADCDGVRRHARTAIVAYLAIASFLPIAVWNGIRRWPEVLAVFAAALILATAAWRLRSRPERSFAEMLVYAFGNGLLLALMTRLAGPFTFVPALICVVTMSVITYPSFIQRPTVLIGMMLASFVVPLLLEAGGVLATTWELRDGGLFSHAGAIEISGTPTVVLVIGATLATVTIAGIHAAALARTNRSAQQQLVTQAWHLRQLLPSTRLTP